MENNGIKKEKKVFKRRTYNFGPFFRDIFKAVRMGRKFSKYLKEGIITSQFMERIMMAVTAVNGCRYCSWAHAEMALKSGCSNDEIAEILSGNIQNCPEDEAVALAYSQHYAESCGHPSVESEERLISCYGEEKANAIKTAIHFITIGNLSGNTIDAFIYRFKGYKIQDSSISRFIFEFLVFLFGWPIALMLWIKNKKKNKISEEKTTEFIITLT